jgi:hypothetical protein
VMPSRSRISRARGEVRNAWSLCRTCQPTWLARLPLFGAVRWMHGPFVETWPEVVKHSLVGCRLVVKADGVAVQEGVVDNRLSLLASLAAAVVEPYASGKAVLLSERHGQVEDVGAAAVGETVPVEVRGCQSSVDHSVDLCAQLVFKPRSAWLLRGARCAGQACPRRARRCLGRATTARRPWRRRDHSGAPAIHG